MRGIVTAHGGEIGEIGESGEGADSRFTLLVADADTNTNGRAEAVRAERAGGATQILLEK